jgi:Flp pilus assembly protein TadD
LQATADRYTYLPGIVLAVAAVGGAGTWTADARSRRAMVLAAALLLTAASAIASRRLLGHWHDSVALWTRVVALQPGNDIGHYNLGLALAESGRPTDAARHYRLALDANPGHPEALANLNRLEGARLEAEGNALASAGDLTAAEERYRQALARDDARAHAHAGRGMVLARLGRGGEAVPHLRAALRLGATDAAIPGALGALLAESGAFETARAVLEDGLRSHPDDAALAHNLARVLVSTPDLPAAERRRALRLAEAVVEATAGRDARALDTLAGALALNGRLADARTANARAVAVAEAAGNQELAVQITARGRVYRTPGP